MVPRPPLVVALTAAGVLLAGMPGLPQQIGLMTVIVTLRHQPGRSLMHPPPAGRPHLSAAARDVARANGDRRLVSALATSQAHSQEELAEQIQGLGGTVLYAFRAVNAVVARVPPAAIPALAANPAVARVEADTERRPQLDLATGAMAVSAFWNAGVTGGATDVAVIDSGLYAAHPAFVARAASVGSFISLDAARYLSFCDDSLSPMDMVGHGTAVTGVLFSQGDSLFPLKVGVAFGIDRLYNVKATYLKCDGTSAVLISDAMAAADASLSFPDPPEILNFSAGGPATGDDDSFSRFWDALVDTFDKVVAVSAGNLGPTPGSVMSPSTAFNVISVGNVNARGTLDRGDDSVALTSSVGPVPSSGRKKPDLVAPGMNVQLPSYRGGWAAVSGTSISTPAVGGVAALLFDAGVDDARVAKAVLVNSADDRGAAGWDASWGWGYVNGAAAYAHRNDWTLLTLGPPAASTSFRFLARPTPGASKATAVWNRHADYSGITASEAAVLNNVDLRLYSQDDGMLLAASESAVDNVEQVHSEIGGPTVLEVVSTGTFSGTSETVALAHSGGFEERQGPAISIALTAPSVVSAGSTFTVSAAARNAGDLRGHGYRLTLSLPPGFSVSDPATRLLGSLDANGIAAATWTVTAPAAPGPATPVYVDGSTSSYGRSRTTSSTASISVGPGHPAPVLAVVEPSSGPTSGGTTTLIGSSFQTGASVSFDGVASSYVTVLNASRIVAAFPPHAAGPVTVAVANPDGQESSLSSGFNYFGGSMFHRRYFAEGTTGGPQGFSCTFVLFNPGVATAHVVMRFLTADGSVTTHSVEASPSRRVSVDVGRDVPGLESASFSTVVESDVLVVVDRTMRWNPPSSGAHTESGVESLASTWYFAEGATHSALDLFYTLGNPGDTDAVADITYLRPTGAEPVARALVVPADSRATVWVGADNRDLAGTDVSAVITSSVPIVAERVMYASRPGNRVFSAGQAGAGVTAPALRWFLAEGATGSHFDLFLLIANPEEADAEVSVDYLLAAGTSITRTYTVRRRSRFNVWVNREDPRLEDTSLAMIVTSVNGVPVVVDRSMWWPGAGRASWRETHGSPGAAVAGTLWGFADGETGGELHAETFFCVVNTASTAASVRATLSFEDGTSAAKTWTVAPRSRFTVAVGDGFPESAGRRFGTLVESLPTEGAAAPIVVERAMYWSADAVSWTAGSAALGTRIR